MIQDTRISNDLKISIQQSRLNHPIDELQGVAPSQRKKCVPFYPGFVQDSVLIIKFIIAKSNL